MPRYDYKCLLCEHVYEIEHKITDDPEILCPKDSFICKRQISKNVTFETPMDVEFTQDPSTLSEKSFAQVEKAKKTRYRW
jgi:putative FmdB family regulatory protein